jgi:hypothetical protein
MKIFASVLFLFVSFSLANATASIAPETSNPPRWEKLGERKVNFGLDHDEILVTAGEGRFTALKFLVKKGGINMHKMVVHFGDGSTEEIELRNDIPAGGESRVIDLPGKKRVIRKVAFWYDTKNYADKKAVVELWGRH